MKRKLLRLLTITGCFVFFCGRLNAQGILTGINGTVITLPCSQTCTNLNFQVPHLKSDEDYQVTSIPYTPYPYTTPTGNELTGLYADDLYSAVINLPFPVCFYGSVYNQVVIGSNGLLTFDIANANCAGAYTISPTIPYALGAICNQNATYYPKAAIMGAFSDLDPTASASPPDRKIEWRFEGTAPFRRLVASWYRVGVWGNNSCGLATPTTFQIVINEATAVIEVFFDQKICADNSNNGRTILGVQDFSRTKAVAAVGKNATIWTANREGYRFVPSGSTSRFVSSELFLLGGVIPIATATTATTAPGLLDIDFGSICPGSPSQQYFIRTIYSSCNNPLVPIVIDDTITINRNPDLGATTATTNTFCGPPSGSIVATIPPGIGVSPYTFVLNPGPAQIIQTGPTPMTFNNLPQGIYTLVITDASGNCTSTLTNITVGRTNNLAATITPIATSCATSTNGSIQVMPTTGSAPYTFVLNPGAVTQMGPTANFTGLAANSYTIDITDASGCSSNSLSVVVDAGAAIITAVNKTDVLCNGGATGTITVTQPVTGTPPYQYSLDGVTWQASNIFTGLIANGYTVYYRDNGGCQNSQFINISEPVTLSALASSIPVVCNGQSNGTITVTTNGGISPYQYSIDGGTTWQNSNVFNVPAGPYTVIIRDVNNCTTTQAITVTEPSALTAFSANGPASCDGGNDGVITVTANGGNAGYMYSLDAVTFQSSNVFNVAPGNYTVTVKDNLGCSTSFPTTVVLGSNFLLTPQIDPTICEGSSTQLQLTSNATIYSWSPATGLSSTSIYNPFANPTVTTQYIVTATLGRCSGEDTVIVNVNTAPIPNAGIDAFICYGQTYQLQASGGTQYSWTPDTYLDNASIANPISTPAKDITYTLSILSDVNGCPSLTTDQIHIDVTPPIKVKTFPYDTVAYNGDQIQLLAVPSDADVINYVWTPATGLSNTGIANPIATTGAIGDVAQYKVVTSTIAGCKGEGYVTIRVYKGPDIYVPTAFTPNGDGKNDKFTPFPVGIKSYKYFRVFNRWGQLIFSTTQLHDGWDGKIGGRDQATGTYIWMIEGVTKDDRVITKKGTVTLIR